MALVNPHGKEKKLKPLLLSGTELKEAKEKAKTLKKLPMTSRETSDLIMMGIGAFTPLEGFMGKNDWKGVVDNFTMQDGTFWPIPITLSATEEIADEIKIGEDVALVDFETSEIMGIINVSEKYSIDKAYECQKIFKTTDMEHPGVQKVMAQGDVNIAGKVKVLSEGSYPTEFKEIYMRPAEVRKIFEEKGWSTVAAFQTRNPMHRSHEYLAKVAIETTDGVLIHQLVGKLKPGDIPANVRAVAINTLIDKYFVKNTIVQAGYPMEMRYAGPREALLHAVFRQNYGCSHLIVGRDHAGVGDYYGPFDAHKIFDEIPKNALELKPLKMDWTFYCHKCDGMASTRTCPHSKEDRLILSGTMLRKLLSEGQEVPEHFSRPEVLKILKEYYASLAKEEKVEVKLHKAAKGEI
ncbi:MAG: sulfate adenylyltransferase [Deltaproteobacteria bacterium]|jgi:sulfate adenylyltransferase|nr:sulfate adenylyltransferase [Deltaproteobacteria bacterium]MCL5879503.1 sulfate adenylyltransferase [Deltaproteobacteria bacterium]MDA8305118.1 sulfate adenylyltransferase [Deltaproteobacteria bacterium]